MDLLSVKMRASRRGSHISGAERLIAPHAAERVIAQLYRRAWTHPKGRPDEVRIRTTRIDSAQVINLTALPVSCRECEGPAAARAFLAHRLGELGCHNGAAAMIDALYSVSDLRGAMIFDAHTGTRIDDCGQRGVRVSTFDWAQSAHGGASGDGFGDGEPAKNYRAEAVALATKAVNAPGIIAEMCISDDPAYTTGYLATASGYEALTNMKAPGQLLGTRVLVYAGAHKGLAATIDWLRNQPVLIQGQRP